MTPNFRRPPLRDPAYTQRARHMPCRRCKKPGETGEVVLAHIRLGWNSGTGMKPPDWCGIYLCSACHAEFDGSPDRCRWLVEDIMVPELESDYRRWKSGVGG